MKKILLALFLTTTLMANHALEKGFLANPGSLDSQIRFVSKMQGHNIFLTDKGLSFVPYGKELEEGLHLRIANADLKSTVSFNRQREWLSLFLGAEKKYWQHQLPLFGQLRTPIFTEIDWLITHTGDALVSDYEVRPGGDPGQLVMEYQGAESLSVLADGTLLIDTKFGTWKETPPIAFQTQNGDKVTIPVAFKILNSNQVTFEIGDYDKSSTLLIDPSLNFSTYHGGQGDDFCYDVAVSERHNMAVAVGGTYSNFFPGVQTLPGVPAVSLNSAAFISVFDLNGNLQGTMLMSGNGNDFAKSVAVDRDGNIVITGSTGSDNFPTQNAFQNQHGSPGGYFDAFVAQLNPNSGLLFSSYLGGNKSDNGNAIAVDVEGVMYVTGDTGSPNFPLGNWPSQPQYGGGYSDAFVAQIDPWIGQISYSTFLGGSDRESGEGIDVDDMLMTHVTGFTESPNFPTTHNYITNQGGSEIFYTQLDGHSNRVYSQVLGDTDGEAGRAIKVSGHDTVVIAGETSSSNFPVTNSAFQSQYGTAQDGFVLVLDWQANQIVHSTFLGGSSVESLNDLDLGPNGEVYLIGSTASTDFPVKDEFMPFQGINDAFISKLDPHLQNLNFSTYFGTPRADYGMGIAFFGDGSVMGVGTAKTHGFMVRNANQPNFGGGPQDGFVLRID